MTQAHVRLLGGMHRVGTAQCLLFPVMLCKPYQTNPVYLIHRRPILHIKILKAVGIPIEINVLLCCLNFLAASESSTLAQL